MQDASSKQETKYKLSHQQTGLPPHSALPIRGKTNKNLAQISPYTNLTQITGPTLEGRNQKEEKIQSWSLGKGDLKHNKLKKNNEKAEKDYINEETN